MAESQAVAQRSCEVGKLLAEIHNSFYRTPDGDHCAYLGQLMFEKIQAAIGAYRSFVKDLQQ